jgi:hypothetical protein
VRYVRPTPGVNSPKLAGPPSVSDSVGGTVPLTVPGASTCGMNVCDLTSDVLPLKSCAIHLSVVPAGSWSGSGSARARVDFHSVEAVVGVEPSVV